jgi:uncharacterized delta-60 repeat protein
MKKTLLMAMIAMVIAMSVCAQTADPTFQTLLTSRSEPNDAILFPDGKYLVTGGFTRVNGEDHTGVIKFNADGTIDNTFNIGTGPNGEVNASLLLADGKILLVGQFSSFNGANSKGLIRLNTDGSIDNAFAPDFNVYPSGACVFAIQPDGKVILASASNILNDKKILRINSNGTLDATFTGPTDLNFIYDVAVQADGKILLSGAFPKGLVRLNSGGAVDGTFDIGTGFNNAVHDVEVTSTGQILAGGQYTELNGVSYKTLVRLSQSGSVDATYLATNKFNGGWIEDMELRPGDKLLVGGYFSQYNGVTAKSPLRLNADGSIDGTFNVGTGANCCISFVTANSSEDVLVLGTSDFTTFAGQPRKTLAVVTSTGTLKAMAQPVSFQRNGWGSTVTAQGNDKILLSHFADEINNTPAKSLTRLNLDGTIDATFAGNSKPSGSVNAIVIDPSGNLIIGGAFSGYDLTPTGYIAKLSSDGILDNTFKTNTGTAFNNPVTSLVQQPDGKILAGGFFTSFNGTPRQFLARLNADGSLDASFNAVNGFSTGTSVQGVYSLALQADGKVLVGGEFTSFDGHNVQCIIRLNSDGTFDDSFLIGTGAYNETYGEVVFAIGLGSSGRIVIGGSFTKVNGNNAKNLALLSSAGELIDGYTSNSFYNVFKLKKLPDGKLLLAEGFGTMRLNANGTIDPTFSYVHPNNEVKDAMITGTSLIAAGTFTQTGNQKMWGIGKFALAASVPDAAVTLAVTSVLPTQVSLTWSHTGTTETGFAVERSTGNNSSYQVIATLPANSTTYSDTGLTPYTTYYYRVRAFNTAGYSAYTNEVSPTTTETTPRPGNFQLIVSNTSEVKLTWTDNASNETGFAIERSSGSPANFSVIENTAPNVTAFSDHSVAANTTFYYRIRATGETEHSGYPPYLAVSFGEGGVWRLRTEFGGIARTDAVAFAVTGKGYIGTGWAGGAQTGTFMSYDPSTDSWTATDSYDGGVRSEAVAFVVNDKAYVGTGEWLDPEKDVWEYDPSSNTWAAKTDFGGTARTGAVGFAVGSKGFIGLGKDESAYRNDLWRFDPVANTWTEVASFPGAARRNAVVFVIGDYAFVGTGRGASGLLKDFYKYDAVTNAWTTIATFPGVAREDAVAFSIDGKGYITTGDAGSDKKDMWRYDATNDAWQQVIDFAGSARAVAVGFAVNGKGYVSTGFDQNNLKDLWEFTPSIVPAPPVAPTNFAGVALSQSKIKLSWTDNTSDETGFFIERSAVNNSSYLPFTTVGANTTTFEDTGLSPATNYYYKIRAVTPNGNSPYAAPILVTTSGIGPNAPSGLTLSLDAPSKPGIMVTWTDNSDNETYFLVQRSVENNTQFTGVIQTTNTGYMDLNVQYNQTYYYRVRSLNSTGFSEFTEEMSINTGSPAGNAPTEVTAEALTHSSVKITWKDNHSSEISYNLYRSQNPTSGFTEFVNMAANSTEYVNTNLTELTTYYYKVRVRHTTSTYTESSVVSVTTPQRIPTAPTNLVATHDEDANTITLTWTDASDNEENFVIEKQLPGQSFAEMARVTNGPYVDDDPGTTLTVSYRVAARNGGGVSGYSNTAKVIITGLEGDFDQLPVHAYPNPASEKLTIEYRSAERGLLRISLMDIAGRVLRSVRYEKSDDNFVEQVDISQMPENSLILLDIQFNGKQVVRKIYVK